MTVEHVLVGDVLALQRRAIDVQPDVEYREVGVRSFGRGIFHKEPINGLDLGGKRVFSIEPGDLVISNVFGWEGAIAVASDAERGMIGSHRFMTFRPKGERVDTAWISWFFLSEPGLDLIRRASPGSAGRNRTLAIERFLALEIQVPPIDEQRRQVETLSRIATSSREAMQTLDHTSPEALARFVPRAIDSLMSASAVGSTKVGDAAEFVSDTIHPGDDPGPADCFVGLQHVESHTGRRLGQDPLQNLTGRKFRFQPGDVVYGYLRPYLNKVWLADRHGLCSVDQYVLRPREGIDGRILAHSLRRQSLLDRAIELTHSLQLPRLRSGLLASLEVPEIPSERVEQLVSRIDASIEAIIAVSEMRRRQTALVAALVPAALNEAFASLK